MRQEGPKALALVLSLISSGCEADFGTSPLWRDLVRTRKMNTEAWVVGGDYIAQSARERAAYRRAVLRHIPLGTPERVARHTLLSQGFELQSLPGWSASTPDPKYSNPGHPPVERGLLAERGAKLYFLCTQVAEVALGFANGQVVYASGDASGSLAVTMGGPTLC